MPIHTANKGRHATAPRPFINDYVEEENESEVDLSDFVSEKPKDMRIKVHSYRALKDREEDGEEDDKVSCLNMLTAISLSKSHNLHG